MKTHDRPMLLVLGLGVALLKIAAPQVQNGTSPSLEKVMQSPADAQLSGAAMSPVSADEKPQGRLIKISDVSKVCMVTNHAFDKPQLPIKVKGKTYYGCCEMCKKAITTDHKQRMAVDPISAKKVDKSQAVIGVAANGVVVYFENEEHLSAYNATIGQ
jgi:YHS domain-containing protein